MKRFRKFLKYLFCNQLFFKHKLNICLHKIIGLNKYLKDHIIYFLVPKFHIIWSSCSFQWVITVWAPKHCPKDWYCSGSIPLQDVYNMILTTMLYFLTSSPTLFASQVSWRQILQHFEYYLILGAQGFAFIPCFTHWQTESTFNIRNVFLIGLEAWPSFYLNQTRL